MPESREAVTSRRKKAPYEKWQRYERWYREAPKGFCWLFGHRGGALMAVRPSKCGRCNRWLRLNRWGHVRIAHNVGRLFACYGRPMEGDPASETAVAIRCTDETGKFLHPFEDWNSEEDAIYDK